MDVLIVDDSMLAGHALKAYFTKLGHNVIGMARDAKQGIDIFTENQPDLVTVDAIMPGDLSGVDFIKFVNKKDKETGNKTKIFFISSDEINPDIRNEIRVDGYIVKPVTMVNIQNSLNSF